MQRASSERDALTACEREWAALQAAFSHTDPHAQPSADALASGMQRLAALVREDQPHEHDLGVCAAYVAEHNVLGDLVTACLLNEPRGVLDALVHMFTELARTPLLTDQRFVRALLELLRFCAKDAGAPPNFTMLVYVVSAQIHRHPDVLRVFVQLGVQLPKERPAERFPLLGCLLERMEHDGDTGRRMRTSLVWLMHALVSAGTQPGVIWPCWHLERHVCVDVAVCVADAISGAYRRLPLKGGGDEGVMGQDAWVYERFARTTVQWYASTHSPAVATWIDTLWLVQSLWHVCSAARHGALSEHAEQFLEVLTEHFQSRFVEACLEPAWNVHMARDADSMRAVLSHIDVLACVMEPCTTLSRCIAAHERSMMALVACALEMPAAHACAHRTLQSLSQWVLCHDATPGTHPLTHHAPLMAFPLLAMAEERQSRKFRASFARRCLTHLLTVEHAMRAQLSARNAPIDVVQQTLAPAEHCLRPLVHKLRQMYARPLLDNVAVWDTLSMLCRSPFVHLDGLLAWEDSDHVPILTLLLYNLYEQARALDKIPDGSFYLEQRKIQQLGTPLSETACTGRSACALFDTHAPSEGIHMLEQALPHRYTAHTAWTPHVHSTTPARAASSLDGAQHTVVSVPACPVPAEWGGTLDDVDAPLTRILDNMILFEEVCLEMACIVLVRQAWGLSL